jgi:hypothetical protein
MSWIRKRPHDMPSERESPIEKLVGWRSVMEGELPYGNIMTLVHARKCVRYYRDKLAPWEWTRCPDYGGRDLWVNNGNRYCRRCSGTEILLVCEQDVPKPGAAPPTRWRSRLRRLGHLNPTKDVVARRLP